MVSKECSACFGSRCFYLKELVKYPPQFKIGVLNNNPPVYDLLPKAKELIEKNGLGRPNP
jgi:arylsulfatase